LLWFSGFSLQKRKGGPENAESGEDKRGKEDRRMPKVEKIGEVFRCEVCGNVVEVKEVGGGELVCCGRPMTKIEAAKGVRRRCGRKSA
jgi:desulfoferrodoxin-like iron-binding protein